MDNHCTTRFINSLLLIWLCCSLVKLSLASNVNTYIVNCTSMEREALIAFKQSLSDPSARLSSWVGENCCQWPGITCSFISGKVTKIDLQNSLGYHNFLHSFLDPKASYMISFQEYVQSCLGGEISPSLLKLKYLSYLDLSLNNFGGVSIPYFFGLLKNLRYLNLSSTYFGGEIPSHLGNLSNLNYLDLSLSNQRTYDGFMYVKDLQWLSGLSSLKYLDIGGVNLSSAQANWMHIANRLPSLSELHLSRCGISSFDSPVGFSNLTSLKVLDLSFNLISSSLPRWLSNLTGLTILDLSANNFQGTIPQDFLKLKNLQYIDVSTNKYLGNIGDHIPSFLRNLCKLQLLSLASNSFVGKLDEFLGSSSNCSQNNLAFLDLRGNRLAGEIPNSIGTFENLQYLYLSGNKLWGSLPNSIGNLSLLHDLDVSANFLNGTIPPSFGQLSKLIQFDGFENSWEAVITKAQLMNLTKLEFLSISTNRNQALVFDVPHDWIPPFKLKTLYLRNCLIGPQFPAWLQVQTQLTNDVIISNAGISGSIPNEWISNISSHITSLDLSNNLLKGKLSHLLASQDANSIDRSHNLYEDLIPLRYPNLTFVHLQNNSLSGPIPSDIGDLMPNLMGLFLSNNRLNGIIPSSIQKMNNLQVLSISNNQLSGELLDYWNEFKELSVIDLANNDLYGKIPNSIGMLPSLDKLILFNNHFHGEIPKSLQNCSNLKSIDLSGNRLHGSLPSWIGVLVPQLMLLNLRSNIFIGIIPRQWCNLSLLRVLDLSNNNLSGDIPDCLYNWTTLVYGNSTVELDNDYPRYGANFFSYLQKIKLVMKGRELEYDTTLKYVLTIDLSRNRLSGEIPNGITKLVHLGTLNLSNNDLLGMIPKNIGAMQQLETLDLSCNHLSGRIPTNLASLSFLTHLNLSFNNLTGRIPTGRQLQTLDDHSIYEGNPSLCGSPLQTKCPSDENTNNVPISTSEEDDKENDSVMLGFYISMAIGFPIGLNILFFSVFTNKSWRISYFRFIDRVSYNILETIGFVAICVRRTRWRRS